MPRFLCVCRNPHDCRSLLLGPGLDEVLLRRLSSSPSLAPRPQLQLQLQLQTSDMHPEEELDVCLVGVEMLILLLVRPLLTLVVVLPALLWTLLVCLFSDTLTYMRGY